MNNLNKHSEQQAEEESSNVEKAVYFEDAIAMTGSGKFHYILLLGSGFCLVSLLTVSLNTSYLLPSAQCDFDMTSQDKGVLSAALFLGMITSSHLWGFLADTRGRRNILMLALYFDATVTIISSFAHTFSFFLFCRFLNGFFICGPSAVVYPYLGEFHASATRTRVVMWASILLALGSVLLPSMAWVILPQTWVIIMPWRTVFTSWRIFVFLCSVPSIMTAIMLSYFLTESPKFLLARGKHDKALEVLKYIYSVNTGKPKDTYPVKMLKIDASEEIVEVRNVDTKDKFAFFKIMYDQTAPLFKTPHLKTTLLACFIQFGLYTSCNGFYLWVPDIFNRQAEYETYYQNSPKTICHMISVLSENVNPVNGKASYFFGINGSEIYFNVTNQDGYRGNNNSYYYSHNYSGNSFKFDNVTEEKECDSSIDPIVFLNTLIIGLVTAVAYTLVGFAIKYIEKKTIIGLGLVISSASGVGLYFVTSSTGILIMVTLFTVFSGLCISVMNSAVIEVYPTHLRAMAVSISLMFGRVGTVFGVLLMGILLDINCSSAIGILSGIVLVCGLASSLFPSPKQTSNKMYTVNE